MASRKYEVSQVTVLAFTRMSACPYAKIDGAGFVFTLPGVGAPAPQPVAASAIG
jgi:hypothetical protein